MSKEQIDVLIVTAAAGEDDAVRMVVDGLFSPWSEEGAAAARGYPFPLWRATYEAAGGRHLSVALTRAPFMGVESSSMAVAVLSELFDIGCFAMCGVCAGRPGWVSLGDVIIADRVYRYDVGEIVGGLNADGARFHGDLLTYPFRASWRLRAEAQTVRPDATWLVTRPRPRDMQEDWILAEVHRGRDPRESPDRAHHCADWSEIVESLLDCELISIAGDGTLELTPSGRSRVHRYLMKHPSGPPELAPLRVHLGPFATGSSLVRDSGIWDRISKDGDERLIRGLDMEASCIGFAAFVREVPWVVAKGVMDFAEPSRSQGYRSFAARAAAEVLMGFLRENVDGNKGGSALLDSGTADASTDDTNPGTLLSAHYEVVAFDESIRRLEIVDVLEWCTTSDVVSARTFVGPGGAGKTRLFIHIASRLRAQGWNAGFLGDVVPDDELDALLRSTNSTLIVIDYVEGRPKLHRVLARLSARDPTAPILRIALLARDIGEWWGALSAHSREVAAMLRRHMPVTLRPVEIAEDQRVDVYNRAAATFSERLGRPQPSVPPDLTHERYGRPLYLQMAALVAIDGHDATPDSILDHVVDHERRYWRVRYAEFLERDWLDTVDFGERVARLMAAVTLRGGVPSRDDLATLARNVDGPDEQRFPHVFRFLRMLYVSSVSEGVTRREYLGTVQPDLLGEALVAKVLRDAESMPDLLDRMVAGATSDSVRHAVMVLGRIGARVGGGLAMEWIRRLVEADLSGRARPAMEAALGLASEMVESTIGRALSAALEKDGNGLLALEIESVIPENTLALREVGVWVAKALIGEASAGVGASLHDQGVHALRLHNLAVRLSGVGRYEEALSLLTRAVATLTSLAAARPEIFRNRLATSECSRAAALQALGDYGGMLNASERACEIFAALDSDSPGVHAEHHAIAVTARRSALSLLGRHYEAFTVAQDAVALNLHLADLEPETFLPIAAAALEGLSDSCAELGKREEALAAAEHAVKLHRELVAARPDAYLPGLATSLKNACFHYAEIGDNSRWLSAASEAVQILRRLTARQSVVFSHQLAAALNNLSASLRRVGRPVDALGPAREAVAIRRQLATNDSTRGDLAMSLNTLATILMEFRENDESVALLREAVDIRRRLAERSPDTVLPGLALNLSNLGGALAQAGRYRDALPFAREAVEVFRALSHNRPERFARNLFGSLCNLSQVAAFEGLMDEARQAQSEAEKLLGTLQLARSEDDGPA